MSPVPNRCTTKTTIARFRDSCHNGSGAVTGLP